MPKTDAIADIMARLPSGQRPFGIAPAAKALGWLRRMGSKRLEGVNVAKLLKDAERQLVYSGAELELKRGKAADHDGSCIGTLDLVISSRRRDRDGDILEPSGAEPDLKMPLLWQHCWEAPIGCLEQITKQNSQRIGGRYKVANTPLGRDAWTLAECGALRVSHGFDPKEYDAIFEKDDEGHECWTGWHIKRYAILEASLVSVPSNTDAVITAMEKVKLHHPFAKAFRRTVVRKALRGRSQVSMATAMSDRQTIVNVKVLNGATATPIEGELLTVTTAAPSLDESFKSALGHLANADIDQLPACRRFVNAAQDLVALLQRDAEPQAVELDLESLLN